MKIRDTVTRLLAGKPQTLVIVPILFVMLVIIALVFTFTVSRNPKQSQPTPTPTVPTANDLDKPPAAEPSQIYKGSEMPTSKPPKL